MRKIRLYHPENIAHDKPLQLQGAACHHLYTVLRRKPGDEVYLFTGGEREYHARILNISKKACELEVLDETLVEVESPLQITLYQALSSNDKMDWVIQKSVELGVQRIVPMFTEYSQVRLTAEKLPKKLEHWQQVAIAASEQSGRTRIAEVCSPVAFADAIGMMEGLGLILHPHHGQGLAELAGPGEHGLSLLVGPEGGFSESEVELAQQRGLVCVRFGPRVLRTETAPLAIVAALQARWGDC